MYHRLPFMSVYDEKRHTGIFPAPAIYGIQNKPKPHSAVSQMQLKTPLKCSMSACNFLVDLLRGGVGVGESQFLHGVVLYESRTGAASWGRWRGIGDGGAFELALDVK